MSVYWPVEHQWPRQIANTLLWHPLQTLAAGNDRRCPPFASLDQLETVEVVATPAMIVPEP